MLVTFRQQMKQKTILKWFIDPAMEASSFSSTARSVAMGRMLTFIGAQWMASMLIPEPQMRSVCSCRRQPRAYCHRFDVHEGMQTL